jgi:glutamine synthetase
MYARPPEEVAKGNVRTLPQSLDEALDELERDDVIQAALGPIFVEFLSLKRKEWNDYHRQVTPWEVERYLTML